MQNVSNLGFQILFMGIFIKKLLKIKEIHKEVDLFLFDLTIFRGKNRKFNKLVDNNKRKYSIVLLGFIEEFFGIKSAPN